MSDQPVLLIHILSGAAAFGAALLLTPVAGRLAGRIGLVAYPRNDRWHRTTVPLLGGIAIFLAVVPLYLVVPQPIQWHATDRFGGLILGATLVFVLGLWDDIKPLPPYSKLLGQVVAACILVAGMPVDRLMPWAVLIVPLTIFWVVGVTNAFNLLDNMDGLSAGIAAIVAAALFGHNVVQGDHGVALICLLVFGACCGFLVFNFNPARIFMGDSGSLVLGYVLSGVVVLGAAKLTSEIALTLLVPVVVMALPILDTTLVTVMRSLNSVPVSQGGRDHLSHRLVALGLTERSAVLVLYLVAALFGAVAIGSSYMSGLLTLVLTVLLLIGVVFFGIHLAQVRVYSEARYAELAKEPGVVGRLVLGGSWLYKRQVAEMLMDLTLICVALLAAYLIRFDLLVGPANRRFQEQLAEFLPIVVSIKLVTLFMFGVYRAIWRYMGSQDMLRIAVASTVGSLAAGVAITWLYRAEGGAPTSVLILDWVLLTVLLVGTRGSFVHIHNLLANFRRRDLVRVIIIGANDTGELVLRALSRNRAHLYSVVGFLDDAEERQDRSIHGVPVLGPSSMLGEVARERGVDEVVFTTPDRDGGLAATCSRIGVSYKDVGDFFRGEVEREADLATVGGR
jgi:UDP-GlcNAc:undecaprenyl-phosphate GlcNAc-1-phosphate transferase